MILWRLWGAFFSKQFRNPRQNKMSNMISTYLLRDSNLMLILLEILFCLRNFYIFKIIICHKTLIKIYLRTRFRQLLSHQSAEGCNCLPDCQGSSFTAKFSRVPFRLYTDLKGLVTFLILRLQVMCSAWQWLLLNEFLIKIRLHTKIWIYISFCSLQDLM